MAALCRLSPPTPAPGRAPERRSALSRDSTHCQACRGRRRRHPRRRGGEEARVGRPAEPLAPDQLAKLDGKLDAVLQEQRKERQELRTLMGSIYDATVAGVPDDRRRTVYRAPLPLAADCDLPHDAVAEERVAESLLDKHEAAHALRGLVMQAVVAKTSGQEGRLPAAVSKWRSLDPPSTAAGWKQEAQALGQVAGTLLPGSEVQQAVLLLRKYSAAALRAEAEGRPDALRQLLSSVPPPGALEWPPAMALAQGLAGKWSRELELDAPLRLRHGAAGSMVVQETKLTAKEVGKATRQLRHASRLLAWLHSALGAPLPPLEGRIVVPYTELREAQRKLRRLSTGVQDSVPGGGGAKFDASISADTL